MRPRQGLLLLKNPRVKGTKSTNAHYGQNNITRVVEDDAQLGIAVHVR